MNGLTILSHSFRQVSGNLGMAIKISGWLVLIASIGGGLMLWAAPDWLTAAMDQNAEGMMDAVDFSGSNVGVVMGLFIAAMVFLFWGVTLVAIAWHRYILLEEVPQGLVPYRKEFQVGRYFWLGIGISLLATLVVGLVSVILGMIVGPFVASTTTGQGVGGISFFMSLLMGVILAVIYLRMALVLPAVALGGQLTIGQAWTQTSGYTGAIFVLALALAFINAVVPIVITLVLGELVWINMAAVVLYQWFYFMLSISVLSTLYGHIVQKREVY